MTSQNFEHPSFPLPEFSFSYAHHTTHVFHVTKFVDDPYVNDRKYLMFFTVSYDDECICTCLRYSFHEELF